MTAAGYKNYTSFNMILKHQNLLLILLILLFGRTYATENSPYVKTPLGGIRGYYKRSAEGRPYAAYESIRYSKSPIGELRFEPPVPITPWLEDIKALSLPPPCPQFDPLSKNLKGVEDCLYLNVYTPAKNENASFPVIFWIHGGGFHSGTSSNYGAKYLMDRDVLLVTINYRLGPLGFLTTGDEVVPGNMGLKDQSLALKWTSDNIKYFGGDPKRITLMGVSGGGAGVHYHYLSPMSRGLFQNGISFSGSSLSTWAFTADNTQTTKHLAVALKCPTDNSLSMVRCIKATSSDKVISAVRDKSLFMYFPNVMFPPVAEKVNVNYFINDTPTNIIANGKGNDVPWIAGIVKDEGLYVTSAFALDKKVMEYTDRNWEYISPYMLQITYNIPTNSHTKIAQQAKEHYFGNESFSTDMNSIQKLTHLVGDELIAIGSIRAAKLQARYNKSPVRFYYYTYRAAHSFSDHLSNSTIDFGVSHDDDIYIVLDGNFINPTTTGRDRAMQQDMLKFWVSYASTGEPDLGISWPRLKEPSDKLHYMHISGPRDFAMDVSDNLAEESFWKQVGV